MITNGPWAANLGILYWSVDIRMHLGMSGWRSEIITTPYGGHLAISLVSFEPSMLVTFPTVSAILSHYNHLHPQTKFARSRSSADPVLRGMKLRNSRNSTDAFTTQLGNLLALARIHVDETIHVSDTESLDAVLRL